MPATWRIHKRLRGELVSGVKSVLKNRSKKNHAAPAGLDGGGELQRSERPSVVTIPSTHDSCSSEGLMAHRTVAATLILIATIILALPAGARQKSVAPTFRACPECRLHDPPARHLA